MINSKYTSINSFWSIFDEPICLNGVEIKRVECIEGEIWDISDIFTNWNWQPKIIFK